MRKPLYIFTASAAITAAAMLLAIKLTLKPEEGPKDSPAGEASGESSAEEAANDGNIISTASGMRLKAEPFDGLISKPEGVCFDVTTFSPTAVGFSIGNSGSPLFYDPHIFPVLQYEYNGEWHELELNSFPVTRDLQLEELPVQTTGMLLDAALYYTRITEPGHYRLIAEVYTSVDGFMKADPAERLFLAAELSI